MSHWERMKDKTVERERQKCYENIETSDLWWSNRRSRKGQNLTQRAFWILLLYARPDVGGHSWQLHLLSCNAHGTIKEGSHISLSHPELQDGWWQPHTSLAFRRTGGRFKKGNGLSTSPCFHSFPSSDLTRTLAETWWLSRSFPNAFDVGGSWLWWLGSSFCPTYRGNVQSGI